MSVINFGKYRGQPYETPLTDLDYCRELIITVLEEPIFSENKKKVIDYLFNSPVLQDLEICPFCDELVK